MKKLSSTSAPRSLAGMTKAILRGGTFHRVQVLVTPNSAYVEHGGLNYKVTKQRDNMGRVICVWSRDDFF